MTEEKRAEYERRENMTIEKTGVEFERRKKKMTEKENEYEEKERGAEYDREGGGKLTRRQRKY